MSFIVLFTFSNFRPGKNKRSGKNYQEEDGEDIVKYKNPQEECNRRTTKSISIKSRYSNRASFLILEVMLVIGIYVSFLVLLVLLNFSIENNKRRRNKDKEEG